MDRIRNWYIRGTVPVRCCGDRAREERLRWFGRVQRRDGGYQGRRILRTGKQEAAEEEIYGGHEVSWLLENRMQWIRLDGGR